MKARWAIALAGIALSVALSLWLHGLFLFLVFPFLAWPFARGSPRRCAACGYETLHPAVRYCPRDGTRLL